MASGVLGPRETDDPFAFVQPQKVERILIPQRDIGWSGPPAEPEKQGKLLPDNCWEETEATISSVMRWSIRQATRVFRQLKPRAGQFERLSADGERSAND